MSREESNLGIYSNVGAELFRDIADVQFPCLFLDVGSSRLPNVFDAIPFDKLSAVAIGEIVCASVARPDSRLEEAAALHWDLSLLNDDGAVVSTLADLIGSHTLVSHNVITDLWLLRLLDYRCGGEYLPRTVRAFCTMRYGARYSTCHVYRGGKKIPKWPGLQALYKTLMGSGPGKGDIFHDLILCIDSFQAMARFRAEEALR